MAAWRIPHNIIVFSFLLPLFLPFEQLTRVLVQNRGVLAIMRTPSPCVCKNGKLFQKAQWFTNKPSRLLAPFNPGEMIHAFLPRCSPGCRKVSTSPRQCTRYFLPNWCSADDQKLCELRLAKNFMLWREWSITDCRESSHTTRTKGISNW